MKTRFLDARNCHALMPLGHGLALIQRLEVCLGQVNDSDGPLKGAIDGLIKRNKNMRSHGGGSSRLVASPVAVAQLSDVETGWINTRAQPSPFPGPAYLHTIQEYGEGLAWKTIIPLQFLLKGWGDANSGYQCYVHTISENLGKAKTVEDWRERIQADADDYYYVGITGRNWLLRLGEHISEMHRGSRKRFHAAWRESLGLKDVLFVSSLLDVNLTFEEAMDWEELHVDKYAYGPYGLNMIPGGFKGLRHLHEHGVIARQDISLEERENAIAEYQRISPRKGVPNPFIAELWKDDDHYLRVNDANPKRLSASQVLEIRRLAAGGHSPEEITNTVGALNVVQVRNVIVGKTYRRVR
ncbi:MAG: hypothetical protein AAFX44_06775 [Pseudomonadota bacterium]